MSRTDAATARPLRIAIVSTPRSGNNWLLHLLSRVYDLPRQAPNSPSEVDWSALPPRCVLLFHWHREPSFLAHLRQHHCHIVGMVRHPLDVLLSVLHYCLHGSTIWLDGEGGNEQSIIGALPCSPAFLEYATGARAGALLSISRQWWGAPESYSVRYEDLLADPAGQLQRLVEALGEPPCRPIPEAVAGTTLSELRRQHPERKYHFWKGQAGLWRSQLPAREAGVIAAAHPGSFAPLGYACDADPCLEVRQADANWIKLLWAGPAEDLPSLPELPAVLSELRAQLERAQARLEPLEGLGPIALSVARRLRQLSLRHPRKAAVVKWLLRRCRFRTTTSEVFQPTVVRARPCRRWSPNHGGGIQREPA